MVSPDSGAGGDAIEIFAGWLSRRESGENVEFNELLRRHPHLAAELAELEATWKRLAAASDPSKSPLSLHERIKSRFGAESVPEVSLREREKSEARADFSSALIAQLAARSTGFGRYKIRGEVARGGMGAILKIWDEDLRRHLAMKVILGQAEVRGSGTTPPVDTSKVARFLEEAQVTGQLDHPGIVPVHELGLDPEGRLYFTMKLVKGRSLKEVFDLVADGKEGWTQTRVLGVLLKVCEAMAYAHDKGVIHRDLKPGNIMVGKFGEVHVMDWGLARILDQPDEKDIRIREEIPRSTELRSDRDEHRGESPESPLYTMDGDVVGTPAYMPPEQAAGRVSEVGPHSDVYALGAMLYHLLAGHMPYVPKGARLNNYAIWGLVQQGPPASIAQLSPETPAELVAICDKAMARDWRERYRDMSELAADLSAYLEHRVVGAYETGTWAETKKWIERNKALAASLAAGVLALAAGLLVSLSLKREADASATDAKRQERIARASLEDVLSLSAIQELTELEAEADRLWPAEPSRLKSYDQWLERAKLFVEGRPADPGSGIERKFGLSDHKAKLAEIRLRAKPLTEAQREADRKSSSKYAEWEKALAERTWLARMLGEEPWPSVSEVEAELAQERLPSDPISLNNLAWSFVNPDPAEAVYGGEVKALLLARRAVAAATDAERAKDRDTLGWALYRADNLDEALTEERRAVDEASGKLKEVLAASLKTLEETVAGWRGDEVRAERAKRKVELEARMADPEIDVNDRRTYEFEDGRDRWWNAQLSTLVGSIEAFVDPTTGLFSSGISPEHSWGIVKRREFAATIEELTVTGVEARRRWEEAGAAIAASPKYGEPRIKPQLGLLPIGADPDSGLWEFAHLQSGEPATRGTDGRLVLKEETGLVFVLIPGGSFWMGAQTDPGQRNYDPQAQPDESPVHELTLSSYFLSKYEMTQRQWQSAAGVNPSYFNPSNYNTDWNREHKGWSALHPVENVSWTDCTQLMGRLSLLLPTEAQWEYGARAGTSTVFWSGDEAETLRDVGNLADAYAKSHGGGGFLNYAGWDDGNTVHAEVGSYRANAFGLHDVHGNAWEWCCDEYGDYTAGTRAGDGERLVSGTLPRVVRGGSFRFPAPIARSANRDHDMSESRGPEFGLRPARGLTP